MTNTYIETVASLESYFTQRNDVAMAFLFGSYAKDQLTAASDCDIAVYFYPLSPGLEWEALTHYPGENDIWRHTEEIVGREVDLLILNRAPATVAFSALITDKALVIKDTALYHQFFSRVSFEAMDFMNFIKDYYAIEQRSHSLSAMDKQQI